MIASLVTTGTAMLQDLPPAALSHFSDILKMPINAGAVAKQSKHHYSLDAPCSLFITCRRILSIPLPPPPCSTLLISVKPLYSLMHDIGLFSGCCSESFRAVIDERKRAQHPRCQSSLAQPSGAIGCQPMAAHPRHCTGPPHPGIGATSATYMKARI